MNTQATQKAPEIAPEETMATTNPEDALMAMGLRPEDITMKMTPAGMRPFTAHMSWTFELDDGAEMGGTAILHVNGDSIENALLVAGRIMLHGLINSYGIEPIFDVHCEMLADGHTRVVWPPEDDPDFTQEQYDAQGRYDPLSDPMVIEEEAAAAEEVKQAESAKADPETT